MAWFCAHAIFYYELKDTPQDSYLIEENVYLVEAPDNAEALLKAEVIAKKVKEVSNSDTSLTLNDVPCLQKFAGIKKVISVSYVAEEIEQDDMPVHGAELTYSQFEVDTLDEVKKLANDESIKILYLE